MRNTPILVDTKLLPLWAKALLLCSLVLQSGGFFVGYTYGGWQATASIEGNSVTTGEWVSYGSIQITKYVCPEGTSVNRVDNGVDGAPPEDCDLQEGAIFGYVHGTKTDPDAPWPELEVSPLIIGGATDENGVLLIEGLEATGRYLIAETDGGGLKLADSEILGLYCEGDGDTDPNHNDNQELTFVPANGVAHCVAYNVAGEEDVPEVPDNPHPSPSGVVLNEFLPNPVGNENAASPNSGEWVELYNNNDFPVDLTGWYVRDATNGAGNTTIINAASIANGLISPATTTIPGHGFLVVYFKSPTLSNNNQGDTVRLFNALGELEDWYSYKSPYGACTNTPTPGGENIDDYTGACSGTVPEGKSFARFIDGIGPWIDPEPTPGEQNRFTRQDLIDSGFSDEMIEGMVALLAARGEYLIGEEPKPEIREVAASEASGDEAAAFDDEDAPSAGGGNIVDTDLSDDNDEGLDNPVKKEDEDDIEEPEEQGSESVEGAGDEEAPADEPPADDREPEPEEPSPEPEPTPEPESPVEEIKPDPVPTENATE